MADKPLVELLPGDLPENWTAGQIVAPTGEEVGLSHQHGYNYLMEMVNKAHLSINIINEAFTSLGEDESMLENWHKTSMPEKAHWTHIVYGNGKFAAMGTDLSAGSGVTKVSFACSTDAVNWSEMTITPDQEISWVGLAFGGGKFVAVGRTENGHLFCACSQDGSVWTCAEKDVDIIPDAVAYGSGKFVLFNGIYAAYSTDGENWTRTTVSNDASRFDHFDAIAYGGGRFVAVGSSFGHCAYSEDGVSWTAAPDAPIPIRGLAYGGGKFVAVGPNGAISSAEGFNWAAVEIPEANWKSIAFGLGGFAAVGSTDGDRGVSAYSEDGAAWTSVRNPPSFSLDDVAYGGGLFVAVCQGSWPNDNAAYSGTPGAQGPKGDPGDTPYIGENGNWWIGTTDTGVAATGGGGGSTTGVTSFKGRTGAITPQSGDYTATQVGAIPAGAVAAIQVLSQAEYDALLSKNGKTLYLIKEQGQ